MNTPADGGDRHAVEEAIGGYDDDAGLSLSRESPEAFLRHSVRLKRQAYEAADAAFDVEFVLDAAAVLQGSYMILNTVGPWAMAKASYFMNYDQMVENNVSLAEAHAPIIQASPTTSEAFLAGLAGVLIVLAKKTYDATKVEKDFAFEEYVTALAIKEVAEEDNNIDAEELLSAFIMKFDVRPDISKSNWHRKLDYYRPSVSIKPIKPQYEAEVEKTKGIIRERLLQEQKEKIAQNRFGSSIIGITQKIGKNLAVGAKQASQSYDPHLLTASKRLLNGNTRANIFKIPDSGFSTYSKVIKGSLRQDFADAKATIKESGLAQTIAATGLGFKISWRLFKHRKDFKTVKKGKTWEEQAMYRRGFTAAVARTSHLDDIEAGQERVSAITTPDLKDSYEPKYFSTRQVQGSRIHDITENIAQQFETAKGFVYANSFMAINLIFGTLAFSSMDPKKAAIATTVTAGLNGVASYANTFMNTSPMLSIGHGLGRQHGRYMQNAERVLDSQTSVRNQLRTTSTAMATMNGAPQPQPTQES